MVKLPNYIWFLGNIPFRGDGNIYSGSAGCDPFYGNNSLKTFRCRVWLNKTDDGLILHAAHYLGEYSYDSTDKEIINEKTFEASPQGISEAELWLNEAEINALKQFDNLEMKQ